MTEQEALLVLNAVPDLGARRIRKLMAFWGSALKVLGASVPELNSSGLVSSDTAENIFHFSKDKFLQGEYNSMKHKGIVATTAIDKDYPGVLNDFEDAPVVLYIKGDIGSLNQKSVALVGSRLASFYGLSTAKAFASAFVHSGLVVVSGLARGIDTAAHQGSLETGGSTIAVIGCGFDHIYPKENYSLMETISRNGAVISEFACAMPPLKHNFPWRNRIISGLSSVLVVIEAGSKSGALITAGYALAQNKDVFVLPSNIDNERALGSNQLIQEGALVALSPDDVLSRIKEGYIPFNTIDRRTLPWLSDEQSKLYSCITCQPVHLDELAAHSGFSVSSLMNILLSMELKHLIRQLPGQYYVRNEHV